MRVGTDLFKRVTFVVEDASQAAQFYVDVFGFRIWYDNRLLADHRFPPSGAPDQARVHLVVVESPDATLGKIGFVSYEQSPFPPVSRQPRASVRMGEPILVFGTDDVERVYARARLAGATLVTSPVNWEVPGADGARVQLRTVSLFDPNGIYLEVSQR